ncbi:hypothetical protein ES703_94165 [subsurface metagenome]
MEFQGEQHQEPDFIYPKCSRTIPATFEFVIVDVGVVHIVKIKSSLAMVDIVMLYNRVVYIKAGISCCCLRPNSQADWVRDVIVGNI